MSLEAIIILLTLLASFSLFIGFINEQQKNILEINDSLNSKINSLNCVVLAESIFSNSALETSSKFNCDVVGNKIISKNDLIKETNTFLKIEKKENIEIDIKHYWD